MGVWRSGFAAFLACSVITSEDIATECTPPSCEVRPYGIQRDTWRIYNGRRDTWRTERRPTRHVADGKELQAERHVAVHVAALRTVCHVQRCACSSTCHAVHGLPASRGSGRGRPDAPPAHVCVEP